MLKAEFPQRATSSSGICWSQSDTLERWARAPFSYRLVPTLWFGAISIVSVTESWRTARPRSAMAHVPFFFTRMFLDFRSL